MKMMAQLMDCLPNNTYLLLIYANFPGVCYLAISGLCNAFATETKFFAVLTDFIVIFSRNLTNPCGLPIAGTVSEAGLLVSAWPIWFERI
jgi:hypothetical protein